MHVLDNFVLICQEYLANNTETISYLHRRGFCDEIIKNFRIGLFPQNFQEIFKYIPAKELRNLGIIKSAINSIFTTWSLIFPINDVYGNIIAIAGRAFLSDNERKKKGIPKYINTVYPKAHHLFGLDKAKINIIREGFVYITEGYTDVISAHQAGLKNIVACCSTAFSKRQLSLIARYTSKVIILFDNDNAGRIAAKKHVEQKNCNEVSVSLINPFSEENEDLDTFLKTHSKNDIVQKKDGYNIFPIW